jgi:uncharacterized protein (TIGR03546 family)
LGVAVGLVPKGNLLAIGLMTIMCCVNVNVAAGLLTAVLVSLVSFVGDPIFHAVDRFLLTADPLRPAWTWFASLPVARWTEFNNTVVLGSFIVSLLVIIPIYRLTLPVCRRVVPVISERVQRWKIAQWLTGASIANRMTTASS